MPGLPGILNSHKEWINLRGSGQHFSEYLNSKRSKNFYTATRGDIQMFMSHLESHGGENPDRSREGCSWCESRSYPDGRSGPGWSASTRKGYLAAIRFLYLHFTYEENLPSIDPSHLIKSPKVNQKAQYTPTAEEIDRFLACPGSPNETLLAHWMAYVPERREGFHTALWRDIDLKEGIWIVYEGKGGKTHRHALHPKLVRLLRLHKRYQEGEAKQNRKIKLAMQDEETAHVLLTKNGKRVHPSSLTKLIKQRGIRADVGIINTPGQYGSVGGKNSRMTPHALRRGWATHALNTGALIDEVSEALCHADITTTRRHYAFTERRRADRVLTSMSYVT